MDYSKLKKDELLDEVDKRKAAGRDLGVDASSTKEDIIASLQIDDDDASAHQPESVGLPKGDRGNIPDVATAYTQPEDGEYRGGIFVSKKDGEPYALCVVADDPYGNTHKLKNTAHFWEGPEADFLTNFTEKR